MKESDVLLGVREVMSSLGTYYMPSVKELRSLGRSDIEREVYKLGGQQTFATKHGIPIKKMTNKWTDEMIVKELKNVINTLNLDHYPTKEEMIKATGSHALSCVTSKRKSYKEWAKLIDMPIKEGDTFYGHQGESILKELLEGKGYKVERLTTNCLYDFLINDYVRVDCKISRLYHGKMGSFYAFNLERPNPDCDVFILILEDDNESKRILVVPSAILQGQKQVSVGEFTSKWYSYENRYDFIDKYVSFYNGLLA